jgi:molybdopterin/thiamine biosynthesis adenylyltransferase
MKVPFISHEKPERYKRQEPLIGKAGQKRLGKSKCAIIGLGSLGSVVAQALARSGVGTITLIDRDVVERENLSTQFLYSERDLNQPKAGMAKKRLTHINPEIKIFFSFKFTDDMTS